MHILIVIIILITIVLITKIQIKVINILDETNVLIKIGLIKFNIEYEKFIAKFSIINTQNFSFNSSLLSAGLFNNIVKKLRVNVSRFIVVRKVANQSFSDIYINIGYFAAAALFKQFIYKNSRSYKNVQFNILPASRNDIDFDFDINFRVFSLLKSLLLNFKKIQKYKKELI